MRVSSAKGAYDVRIGRGLLVEAGPALAALAATGPCLVVTDGHVAPLYLEPVLLSLAGSGFTPRAVTVAPGERSKSMATLDLLFDELLALSADRTTPVVALGGGVVTDLAGIAAATWLRGVPWLALPTTLLAQVDASVGGKTGINLPAGKNLVGAFHPPLGVLADLDVLGTLDARQFRSGLAEVAKTALALDPSLLREMERRPARFVHPGEPLAVERAVTASVRAKAEVVEADEREAGLRRVLNLGHTAGHAIEASAGYKGVLHGEAVAVGIVAAVRISVARGLAADGLTERVIAFLGSLGLPTSLAEIGLAGAPDRLREHMTRDKKRRGGRLALVLLEEPGRAVVVEDGSVEEVLAVL